MSFNIIIDKKIVTVNNNLTILQACESANIIVPKFCYHERLSIAGNCRMCLVEIDKAPKLVASCAMPVIQNMRIHTNSLAVKKAREGVLEFLLINHPLDCGICDQAGECDLQEQSKGFGSDRGRFQENKRAVQDFECGPLIKTIMTRCIHCTRCVRFANEIIGLPDLGTSGRGSSLEINLYIKKLFKSEFSGNLIDLCPVGALTSKPYSFTARSWELKSIESIDVLDGIGSNIRLDTRGYELMRILPRLNENINEEWISDKTRFAFDGLRQQRLYEPLLKNSNNKFEVVTWKQAIQIVVKQLNTLNAAYSFGATIGPQADCDSISLLNYLIKRYNGGFLDFENLNLNNIDFKCSYLFNSQLKNLEKADVCVLLGVNPRIEGAILNLRLRKRYLDGNFKIASFGSFFDVSFPVYNLGSNISNFLKFMEGRHLFSKIFSKAKQPVIIIGQSFFETVGEKQSQSIINLLAKNKFLLNNNWCGINILNTKASDTGKYEIGCKTTSLKNLDLKLLYSVGEAKLKKLNSTTFIIYQGYQANTTTNLANLILPGKSFIEKISKFINIEGRHQLTKTATSSPTSSKEDWGILYAILEKTNLLPFVKINTSCSSNTFSLLDPTSIMQKIEMEPFYGVSKKDYPSIIDLNLNNNNSTLMLINTFKDLNIYFFLDKELEKKTLKVFSELNLVYPEIFELYIQFTEIIQDLFQFMNNIAFFGLQWESILRKKLFYYNFVKNSNILLFFKERLEVIEHVINMFKEIPSFEKYQTFDIEEEENFKTTTQTADIEVYALEVHFDILDPISFPFSLSLFFSNPYLEIVHFQTFKDYVFLFNYLAKLSLVKLEKFLNFLPEILKQGYIYNTISFVQECFYAFYNIYKLGFFYDSKANMPFEDDTLLYSKTLYEYLPSIRSQNEGEDILLGFIAFGYYAKFSVLPKPEIWVKLSNDTSSLSLNKIHSVYIGDYKLNKIAYQSFSFKHLAFPKRLKNIVLLENKILPSSRFDNFYLMEDFSKFSILMKHCSDVFLERSLFKK